MRLSSLSLRQKLPLWSGFLILVTAFAVTSGYLLQVRGSVERNMLARAETLGRSIGSTLHSALTRDDVWRAYEIITGPFESGTLKENFQIEQIIVLDGANQVFVSTQPERFPIGATLAQLGPDFVRLGKALDVEGAIHTVRERGAHILLAIPLLAEDRTHQGHLILMLPTGFYWQHFANLARRATWITLLVLAVLLPMNWLWTRRLSLPLQYLAARMDDIDASLKEPPRPPPYARHDELGRLFDAFERMRGELVEKEEMRQEMIRSERLAALGRLAASVAHEINNPLGGLITAVDTLKHHAGDGPVTQRVIPLLERGLEQIRDVVAALLVEARSQSHPLRFEDVEDVQLLVAQEMKSRNVRLEWRNSMPEQVALPATPVRQILINLLLNAVQAAADPGLVQANISCGDGAAMPTSVQQHLFEPFSGARKGGHGMGLWVIYQVVQQLNGHIRAATEPGLTRFLVTLPLGENA